MWFNTYLKDKQPVQIVYSRQWLLTTVQYFLKMPSYHICTLEFNERNLLNELPPTASLTEKLTRYWRKITLIDTKNPRCRLFFRSEAAVDYERQRHLRLASNVYIHPFSIFRSGKTGFYIICIFQSPLYLKLPIMFVLSCLASMFSCIICDT